MKRLKTSLMITLVLTSCCLACPLQLQHITSEAAWVVHADTEKFMSSEIGGLIIASLKERGLEDKLVVFQNMFGFDPTRDLAGITLFGPDSKQEDAIALLYGTFAVDKLLALLNADDTHEQYSYGAHEIHRWVDRHKDVTQFGSFARADLIVMGRSAESVEDTLDVLDGTAENVTESDSLLPLDHIPAGSFFVAAGDDVSALTADKQHAAVLRNTDTAAIFVGEVDGEVFVDLSLQVLTAEAVAGTTQIFQGIIGFAILNQEKMPLLANMARAIEVDSQDNSVTVTFAKPAAEVFEFLSKVAQHKKHREH